MADVVMTIEEGLSFNLNAPADDVDAPGARLKTFTATADASGTYPVEGVSLDFSDMFPNKVAMVLCSRIHDPARAAGDYALPIVYVPDEDGSPDGGKFYMYDEAGLMQSDNADVIKGFAIEGYAIGY